MHTSNARRKRRSIVTSVLLVAALLQPSVAMAQEIGLGDDPISTPTAAVDKEGRVRVSAVPRDKAGNTIAGQWYGPYHVQNQNSNLCIDMRYNKTAGALAVQWSCQAGRATQMWWVWYTHVEGSIAIQYMLNHDSGMCLETWNGHQNGIQLTQNVCNWANSGHLWTKSGGVYGGFWVYSSNFSYKCIDVAGFSRDIGASILQWDCTGNSNQRFAERQF